MAQAPSIRWYDGSNANELVGIEMGEVIRNNVAGTEQNICIWNNRGGSAPVASMLDCTITIKSLDGGNNGEPANDTWIQAKCEASGISAFTSIGGWTTIPVRAAGQSTNAIIGIANDGTLVGATGNYAYVGVRPKLPLDATLGGANALLRIYYYYE